MTVDYNKLQAFGRTNEVLNLEPLTEKWESFGWNVQRINGHDLKEIEKAFNNLSKEKPFTFGSNSMYISGLLSVKAHEIVVKKRSS